MRLIQCVLVAACLSLMAAPASASPVLVLGADGRVVREQDRFVPAPTGPPPRAADARKAAQAAGNASLRGALRAMLGRGEISQSEYDERIKDYDDALFIRNRLGGTRRRELTAVISSLNGLAGRGQVTASRLEALWLELNRNAEWWAFASRIPGSGERVRFSGSRVLFQYFPGQGLRLHPLANWGRASGLLSGGYLPNARAFLAELLPLAAMRGNALAWEYYMFFGGGRPPWTSGLSQGTALVALARAYRALGGERYLAAARQAVRLYNIAAPLGVRVRMARGNHYTEYSFAPRLRIINGFIQALNGLWDMRPYDPLARSLFAAGDREARYELPFYDTGRWSRYSNARGSLSTLGYHILLRDFLRGLCRRSRIAIYCSKAARFTAYLRRGPPRGG